MTRGGAREKNGRFYAHARFGKGKRLEVSVPWAKSLDEAIARAELVAVAADRLLSIGRRDLVKATAKQIAEASTPQRLARVQKTVDVILKKGFVATSHDITFGQWATRYTSGDLARLYPDTVRGRDHSDDVSRLNEYILKFVEDVPVVDFQLAHAQHVLAELPVMSEANRRQIAQIMGRLMHLAVNPGGLIKASPLPRGWLPKVTKRRYYSCLYPREEATFLAHAEIPEVFRLFCGVLDREGMRLSMLLDSDWWQWGDVGTFTSTRTKTGDPHMVAVRPDTAEAMRAWREKQRRAGKASEKPFAGVLELVADRTKIAEYYRRALRLSGITREELFASTEFTGALRAHDMRATFVTVSLAEGRTETWIRDRTSHKSTAMIDRYRRTARQFVELDLGPLGNLGEVLGWWKRGGKAPEPESAMDVVGIGKCTGEDLNLHALRRRNLNSVGGSETTAAELISRGMSPVRSAAKRASTSLPPPYSRLLATAGLHEQIARSDGSPTNDGFAIGEGTLRARDASERGATKGGVAAPTQVGDATPDGKGQGTGNPDPQRASLAEGEEEEEPASLAGSRPATHKGPVRATLRHGPPTPAEARLATAQRGAAALALDADVLEQQLRAFGGDDPDGDS